MFRLLRVTELAVGKGGSYAFEIAGRFKGIRGAGGAGIDAAFTALEL